MAESGFTCEQVIPVLMVRDVARSLRFFCERLGFASRYADHPETPHYAMIVRDRVILHLQSHGASQWSGGAERPNDRLEVSDPDALAAACRGPDLVRTAVTDTAWGTREFHLKDPDGNGLQFFRRR
jgi:catechol 2,3-dioxygenase-like lactoylglutathione lyase family enzyme